MSMLIKMEEQIYELRPMMLLLRDLYDLYIKAPIKLISQQIKKLKPTLIERRLFLRDCGGLIILTEMQFSGGNIQTVRKYKKGIPNYRSRSLDVLHLQELSPRETKLLLSVPKQPSTRALETAIMKQELLVSKKLFDPFKYFGCPNFHIFEDSFHYHRNNLDAMFGPTEIITERKAVKKQLQEMRTIRIEQESPMTRYKPSCLSIQKTRRTVARSPKSYVKENKQNYQRLNINNMQKVRVKLRLNKR